MYENWDGGITCCFCRFRDGASREPGNFDTPDKALIHLVRHRLAGHKVPQHALDQLRENAERRRSNEKSPA